ncbi:hypothetical protein GCM10022243_51070 [Saccharothrix violaceirubra]|uniref:Plasmid replication, integration and excision activator n=1 Tax=Saccharothrix violaceirubra TaxID=413306 RepID=A0A7W7SXY1_9PSEU|nr:hypothetical protein [Saccharothrix violaceirubra]MBB4962681.1 hypothetical protein [Saccharothrix violaceirubra]
MAVPYGTRFAAAFDQVFPMGALMVGEVAPDMEYLSAEDKARGKHAKQRVDERTGKRQWKVVVTDPSAEKERDASVTVTLLADVQPVPPDSVQVMPGIEVRPIAFDGLTVEPRVMGDRYKYQGFAIRATALVSPPGSAARRTPDKTVNESKAA